MKNNFQGQNAVGLFHGKSSNIPSKLLYGESTSLFSEHIKKLLIPGEYSLLDLGSHQGEFLEDLVGNLKEYSFNTTAVDVNESDLKLNKANFKIQTTLSKIPCESKTFDISLARYAIAWNDINTQKKILKEISRVTKKIAIIQHQGADSKNPEALQNASEKLFDGSIQPLKRCPFYFSTSDEIESWLTELELKFERIQNRKIENLSQVYIEKYQLSNEDATKVKTILSDSDYLMQSAWIIKF